MLFRLFSCSDFFPALAGLFDKLYHSVPSLMQSASDCNKQSQVDRCREFKLNYNYVFPVGRKFANYRQLDSYVTKFLSTWKIIEHRDGNSLKRFYAESNLRSESKMFSTIKKKKFLCLEIIMSILSLSDFLSQVSKLKLSLQYSGK